MDRFLAGVRSPKSPPPPSSSWSSTRRWNNNNCRPVTTVDHRPHAAVVAAVAVAAQEVAAVAVKVDRRRQMVYLTRFGLAAIAVLLRVSRRTEDSQRNRAASHLYPKRKA